MYPFSDYAEQAQVNLIYAYYQNKEYPSAAATADRAALHVQYAGQRAATGRTRGARRGAADRRGRDGFGKDVVLVDVLHRAVQLRRDLWRDGDDEGEHAREHQAGQSQQHDG